MYLKYFLLLLNVVLLHASPLLPNQDDILLQIDQEENEISKTETIYRLSDDIIPNSYELSIIPDLEKFIFSGKIEIEITVRFSTKQIILHSKSLKISSCNIYKFRQISNTFKLDEANEILIIETEQTLEYGKTYTMTIEFEGVLSDDMKGFYRSSYKIDDKKYWLAVTKFETSSAREAFPCFDEPRFRTPFVINIGHSSSYQNAVSNMPYESKEYIRDFTGRYRLWTKFQRTPPMATYLVAFMLSQFEHSSDNDNKVSVYARQNAIQHVSYALQRSTKSLNQLEGYVGISHKLPKLDVVAVPDFQSGAMENWGMTTYRERYVLLDETQPSSVLHKRSITQVISHEFAHQWFGDLVTPAWWDYLWLNEGFARYFEYFTAAAVEPTWDLDKFFVTNQVLPTLWNEITTQRAMTTSVTKKNQLREIFDVINYPKAASIIRMFENMVSPQVFEAAVHRYLKKGIDKYGGTVVPSILFEAFDEQISFASLSLPEHTSISDIMKTWTENIGYPLITVSRCYHHGKVSVSQTAYKSPRAPKPLPDQKWIVPLTYTTKSQLQFANTKPTEWSMGNKFTRLEETFDNSDWVLFNIQHSGYYRVNYDLKNWNLLIDQLFQDPEKIHVLNRAQLINDAFSLAYDGKLEYKIFFNLIQYLPKEKEIFPWITAANALNLLLGKYEDTLLAPLLKTFITGIVEKSFNNFGFDIKESDSHATKAGNPVFLELACKIGLKTCVDKALEDYNKNKNALQSGVQPDLKKVVFCSALRDSEDKSNAFANLWKTYTRSDLVNDKLTIIESLSCVKDEDIVKQILSKIIDSKNEDIRKQDTYYVYRALFSEIPSTNAGIKFLQDRISTVPELDKDGVSAFESILKKIKSSIKTKQQIDMLKDLEQKAKTLDQTKYGHLTSLIHSAQTKASKRIQKNTKQAEILIPIVGHIVLPSIYPDTPSTPAPSPSPPTTQSPSSGAVNAVSSIWTHLIICGVFFRYALRLV